MKLDPFLLNEMAWNGYSFEALAEFFRTTEDEIILCLQPEPDPPGLYALNAFNQQDKAFNSVQHAGFSREEIRQSIEHQNNADRMEKKRIFRRLLFYL